MVRMLRCGRKNPGSNPGPCIIFPQGSEFNVCVKYKGICFYSISTVGHSLRGRAGSSNN